MTNTVAATVATIPAPISGPSPGNLDMGSARVVDDDGKGRKEPVSDQYDDRRTQPRSDDECRYTAHEKQRELVRCQLLAKSTRPGRVHCWRRAPPPLRGEPLDSPAPPHGRRRTLRPRGARFARRACARARRIALGAMYGAGIGVPEDFAAAVAWLRRAAGQGHAEAQSWLARFHEKGGSIPEIATDE